MLYQGPIPANQKRVLLSNPAQFLTSYPPSLNPPPHTHTHTSHSPNVYINIFYPTARHGNDIPVFIYRGVDRGMVQLATGVQTEGQCSYQIVPGHRVIDRGMVYLSTEVYTEGWCNYVSTMVWMGQLPHGSRQRDVYCVAIHRGEDRGMV